MNRALRIHTYGGPEVVRIDQASPPTAAADEIVVRVHAAGVNGLDWKIRDGLVRDAFPLRLPITLGIEISGEVVMVGSDVTGFAIGDRVMGALGGLGAYADQVAVAAGKLIHTPENLDDVQAGALSVAALTAWQALFNSGELKPGQKVLIHGAAGGVGGFAVQFARRQGAIVICTAQEVNADYLRGLGADEVIDYRTTAFWDHASNIDLVLDLVGGNTLVNSWQVLAGSGKIVSTAAPEIMASAPPGKGIWFQMRPDAQKLAEIASLVARGELKIEISEVVGLEQAAEVIERNKIGHRPGKAVIRF